MKTFSTIFTLVALILILALTSTSIGQTDWATAIDTTWGEGLPTEDKLQILDNVWNKINSDFACFHGLEVDFVSML